MRKPLTVGDLVWYNVGGRGYETMGLVIETADLWRPSQPWDQGPPKKYANSVRIQWMRIGKLKPRTIRMPVYRRMIKMTYEDMITLQTIVEDEVEFTFGDWGEGQGIGSSDVSAVMNAVVPQVNGRFEIHLPTLRNMIHNAISNIME